MILDKANKATAETGAAQAEHKSLELPEHKLIEIILALSGKARLSDVYDDIRARASGGGANAAV